MSDNPYEAPEAHLDDPLEADAAAVRTGHLRREASLRVTGVLFLLGGALFSAMAAVMAWTTRDMPDEGRAIMLGATGAFLVVGLVALVAGWGYCGLRAWVRIPAAIAIGLVTLGLFPLTLPVMGFVAYLTFSGKGLRVLSPGYAALRRQAMHLNAWSRPGEALALLGVAGLYVGAFAWIAARMPAD